MRINRPRGKVTTMRGLEGARGRHRIGAATSMGQGVVIHHMHVSPMHLSAHALTLPYQVGGYTVNPVATRDIIRQGSPSTADEWVGRNLKKVQRFAGRWVAVTEHGIVANSLDFDDLYSKAKAQGVTNPLVFKVPAATRHPKVVSVREL